MTTTLTRASTDWIKQGAQRVLPRPLLRTVRGLHYLRKLARASVSDEPDLVAVRALVKPGDVALDVGANFGLYTRFLSEWTRPGGAVFSVEPMPETFAVLARNIRRLGLTNATPVNCAVSDSDGPRVMAVPSTLPGIENFYQARLVTDGVNPALRRVVVQTHTLDDLFGHLANLSFIKCDVEGHEWPCFRGAVRLLRRFHPALLVEIARNPDKPGSDAAQLFDLFQREGYEPYLLRQNRLARRRAGEIAVNYFFLRPEHRSRIAGQGFGIEP